MPEFDAAGSAALDKTALAKAWFVFIDFVDDPLRVTTLDKNTKLMGTGDADLDGFTFAAFDGSLLDIGDISYGDGGSNTLTLERSGLPAIDAELLAQIADRSRWFGRTVRVWGMVHDETGTTPMGAIVPYYTGYASRAPVIPGKDSQTVRLEVENYRAAFSQASNRSYLNQKDYDPDDESAQATLAAANMGRGVGGGTSSSGSGGTGRTGGFIGRGVRPV